MTEPITITTYRRVSTDQPTMPASLEQQLAACRAYVEAHGGLVVSEVYQEPAAAAPPAEPERQKGHPGD